MGSFIRTHHCAWRGKQGHQACLTLLHLHLHPQGSYCPLQQPFLTPSKTWGQCFKALLLRQSCHVFSWPGIYYRTEVSLELTATILRFTSIGIIGMCDLAPFFLTLVMLFPIFLLQWISTPLSTQPNTLLCRMRTEGSSRTKAYWGSFSISQEYFLGDRVWCSPKLASGYVKGMTLKLLFLLLLLFLRAGTMDIVLLGQLRKLTLTTLALIPDNCLCSGCFWQLIFIGCPFQSWGN